MDAVVMTPAQADEIGHHRWATMGVELDVMDLVDTRSASREAAASIAEKDGSP